MPTSPLVDQGSLNRIRASVVWPDNPQLNLTSGYLAKEGLRLALEGNASDYLPTMTGAVPSPAPYQIVTLTMALVKSQPLAAVYKAQFESNCVVGDATVRPDSTTLGLYSLNNLVLESVREMSFAGEDPSWVVTAKGYYLVNSFLFNT
jgi:hypothetical protein